MSKYDVTYDTDTMRVPVKHWTRGVPFDEKAKAQVANLASMPFVQKHVAVMPDVHFGLGATIGSVFGTKGALIPAAVGVDIGCGIYAAKLNITADQLPDNLKKVRSAVEAAVPHGFDLKNKGVGSWYGNTDTPDRIDVAWNLVKQEFRLLEEKYPKLSKANSYHHLGTLGSGNHFIELCLDEGNGVWLMIHSGSRGVGNAIGRMFIKLAQEDMRRHFINLPDKDLAYVVEGSQHFNDYVQAMTWAQDFAKLNREVMIALACASLWGPLGQTIYPYGDHAVNCHHNYCQRENHYGQNMWITRKGAVRAREGDLGVIPGSMGERSYIVRGLGNKESFCSCSHGAGRVMSRNEARKTISLEQHTKAVEGVECRIDADVIDESPAAYKDIDAVMAAQSDLVEIVHTLKQVVCVKG